MGCVVNATPQPLYPRKRPVTHYIGGWLGPRVGLDGCGKSRPAPEFDPRTVQPVASRYTERAIPVHFLYNSTFILRIGNILRPVRNFAVSAGTPTLWVAPKLLNSSYSTDNIKYVFFFDVLLTVHFSIILAIYQLNAHIIVFDAHRGCVKVLVLDWQNMM